MNTRSERIKGFKQLHPIWQARNTGRFGWEQYLGGADLRKDFYKSKKAAELARAKAAEEHAAFAEPS